MNTTVRFMFYNAYGVGGIGRTSFNFANYLVETGKYDVEIISIRRTSDNTTFWLNPKIKITVIQDARRGVKYTQEELTLMASPSKLISPAEDQYPMFNAYTDMRIKEVLSSLRDGVLITTMISLNALSVDLVDDSVLKIGQVHTEYSNHPVELQNLMRKCFPYLDVLTILLENNRRSYESICNNMTPIYLLPNGTKLPFFRSNLKNHTIIAAGRYVGIKGYENLIRAFAMIADKFPDWIVKIYGWGDAANYQRIISEFGIENQVILEPGTDKMNEKFSEASLLVCSSKAEGLSMTIIEALALGLPCVSFMCGGPTEMITDGHDGLLVPKEDVKGLSEAMARVMNDFKFRNELGKNAYNTAKEKYDINKLGALLDNIITTEINAKKNQPPKIKPTALINEDSIQKEIKYLNPDDYRKITDAASNGEVGLRTILKMTSGWLSHKTNKSNKGK